MKASRWRQHGFGIGMLVLLALALHAGPAAAQSADARWNALYDRIIRLEHELRTLKRNYERRIRQLEQQVRRARAANPHPARRTGRASTPTTRTTVPASDADKVFASLPPLRQPQVTIDLEDDNGQDEQVLGRLRADDLPTTSDAAPPRPATSPATPGPIALPGAITDAVGAPPSSAATGLAPGRVAVSPLPPPAGSNTGTPPAATPSIPAPPGMSIPPALAGLSADALLQRARQDFLARRYTQSEQAYRAWLARFANHPRAADARFELGETLYIQGRFKEAGKLFVEAYRSAPDSSIAPRALLRLGQALKRMGRNREACKALQSLRQRYPDSRAARLQAPLEMKRLKCKG